MYYVKICLKVRCLNKYHSEIIYKDHIDQCENHKPSKPRFKNEEYLTYKKFYQKNEVPFVTYADFGCYNIPINILINEILTFLFLLLSCACVIRGGSVERRKKLLL